VSESLVVALQAKRGFRRSRIRVIVRADSLDSRYIGPVPFENIEREAFMIFWPPGHIRLL
jgi:type IV secretory pathway protease TraF